LTQTGTFKIIRDGSHYENVIKILENDCKLERRTTWMINNKNIELILVFFYLLDSNHSL
jgi:hypothetical protein